MPNPSPKTDHLKTHQVKPQGDRILGKVIGTRYPVAIQEKLLAMPSDDMQEFIRAAVIDAIGSKPAC